MKFRQGLIGRSLLAAIVVLGVGGVARAESVVVEGNHRVDSDTIQSFFHGSDTNKSVKDLYATGMFSDVRVAHQGGRLIVHVVENKNLINRVAFEGNSKIKSEQLSGEIRSKSRGAYDQATVDADVQRILDVYRRSGRSAASVSARTVDMPNGRVDVVFKIDEGDKTGVRDIRFVGNHVYSTSKLVGLMEMTEMNWLSFIKSSDVYDPDRLGKDEEAIRRFYLKNGYADFRVVGSDAIYEPARQGYVVTITVDEGPQYTVGTAGVESHLADVPEAALAPYVRLTPGEIYNGDKVEKTVEALTREVMKRGYAFSQVRPRGDRDPATRTVALNFVVEEAPRVYIERINIHGNTRTREYVIRREFEIGEGDAYNKVLIDRAERRLNSLGYFKKVKITNQQGSTGDRVVVDVEVEDQSTGSFSVSGGYSTVEGFIAEVSVSESNFMGRGQYVRTSVSVGQYSRGVELNFTEPYFLGERLAAGFDLYSKLSGASPYSYYSNWVTGGTIRFGIPINDDLTFAPRYSVYNSKLTIPNTPGQPFNDCATISRRRPPTTIA